MRNLRHAVLAGALVGNAASAGWRVFDVPGTPNDLQVMDAGHVVFATTAGAFDVVFADDGGSAQDAGSVSLPGSGAVGAWHDYDGGLVALGAADTVVPAGTCLGTWTGLRHTSSGMGYAAALNVLFNSCIDYSPSGSIGDGGLQLLEAGFSPAFFALYPPGHAMSAIRVGSQDFAVFGDNNFGKVHRYVDAGSPSAVEDLSSSNPAQDLSLFSNDNGLGSPFPGVLVTTYDGGVLAWVSDIRVPWSPVPVVVPPSARVQAASITFEDGSPNGRGFGVATAILPDAGAAILRSVPDPANAGRLWAFSSTPAPDGGGTFGRVSCVKSAFCAAITSAANARNVLVYWNSSPPNRGLLSDGGTPILDIPEFGGGSFPLDLTDSDGDPVYITQNFDAGEPRLFVGASADAGSGLLSLTFVPDAGLSFCGTSVWTQPYSGIVSDGFSLHDQSFAFAVNVIHPPPATPTVNQDAGTLDAGSGGSITFTATSGGGPCQVFLQWSEVTDSGYLTFVNGGNLTVYAPTPSCGADAGPAVYKVLAFEDGGASPLSSLDASFVTVTVSQSSGAIPVTLTLDPDGGTTSAGASPLGVQVNAGGGCGPISLSWSQVNASPSIVDSGYWLDAGAGGAEFFPPPYLCSSSQAVVQYSVQADAGFGSTAAASVAFYVDPWGPPYAPVFSNPKMQDAGTSRVYSSEDAGHYCPMAPVVIEATLVGGGPLLSDGGPGVAIDAGAGAIWLQAQDCLDGDAIVSARHVVGDAGSAWSDLRVSISTWFTPLSADSGFSLDGTYASFPTSQYSAALGLGSANCIDLRNLRVAIDISLDGGGIEGHLDASVLATPSSFVVGVDAGCAGGQYFVNGALSGNLGSGGVPSSLAINDTFMAPPLDAKLGEIDAGRLVATCEKDSLGDIEVPIPQDACKSEDIFWEQDGGPQLDLAALRGPGVTLKTLDAGLDQCVGLQVQLFVTAKNGLGSVATVSRTLTIEADPFVDVRHFTDAPIVDESGVLTMVVELTNRTACGVTGTNYDEQLDGLRYVTGSARFDGLEVDASVDGGVLHVLGLDLPAMASHLLSYAARPPLLGRPAPAGMAQLRGVQISEGWQGLGSPDRKLPGCGCGMAPTELAFGALGLVAFAALRRRRRP